MFIAWNLAMIIMCKLINLYILNMCISLYVNYTSIKLLRKGGRVIEGEGEGEFWRHGGPLLVLGYRLK